MGRYIEWDDVVDRYPVLNTLGGSDELAPTHIAYSEAFVDGLLADNYTVPFSNNNMTVRDLAIEGVYYRAGRFKLEDATAVYSEFIRTIDMIKKGQLNMIDTNGNLIDGIEKNKGLYSSTQSYHSVFGIDDPINWNIDDDQITAIQDARS